MLIDLIEKLSVNVKFRILLSCSMNNVSGLSNRKKLKRSNHDILSTWTWIITFYEWLTERLAYWFGYKTAKILKKKHKFKRKTLHKSIPIQDTKYLPWKQLIKSKNVKNVVQPLSESGSTIQAISSMVQGIPMT